MQTIGLNTRKLHESQRRRNVTQPRSATAQHRRSRRRRRLRRPASVQIRIINRVECRVCTTQRRLCVLDYSPARRSSNGGGNVGVGAQKARFHAYRVFD